MPYKDISMIMTPLFPYFGAVFLRIFGDEIIVMRILEILMTSIILFVTYKILIKLKINDGISLTLIFRIILYIF